MTSIKKNTAWSITEFSASLFIQFFVMRYIAVTLGIKALGIWSVLISAVQMARLFDPGAAAGAGRFLARAHAEGDFDRMLKIMGTLFYATVPLYIFLSLIAYLPLRYVLEFAMTGDALTQGRGLLVYAISSYVFQTVAGTYASALVGLHFGYIKSIAVIVGSSIQAVVSIYLLKAFGLSGFAIGQIANYVFVLIVVIIALRRKVGVPYGSFIRCDWQTFRTVMAFGMGLQGTSIAWAGFEMSIRFIMARFGGIADVGYYEVAYKTASQARVLAFYVGQSIAAALAAKSVKGRYELIEFFRLVYSRYAGFAILSSLAIILTSPLISLIMLRKVEPIFLYFCVLTSLGTAAHITAITSELAAISLGVLRYNMFGTVTAFVAMLFLGCLLGYFFHAGGVAAAVLISSLLAASVPVVLNSRKLDLPFLPNFRRDLKFMELIRSLKAQ